MTIRAILISAAILSVSSMALADSGGTPEQRAACALDVRKFCHNLKESDGDDAYLKCLEINRSDLSAPCDAMLKNYAK
jgi:hypothetical protein